MAKPLQFWFDFASTYSYLTAMRIDEVAQAAGVEVVWRPFLLGPIFKAQGWDTSPFNLYPDKGRYMVRDCTRIAATRQQSFRMPEPFPQNSLLATRAALVALDGGWGPAFIRSVFRRQFSEGRSIATSNDLAPLISALGMSPARVQSDGETEQYRLMLRAQVDLAKSHGIFGAPTLRTADGELYWGDDRLEMAMAHARTLQSA